MRRRLPILLVTALLLLAFAAFAAKKKQLIEQLPPQYREWLEIVDLLITDEEVESFLALKEDYQRDAFIERFWRIRDPYADTARNELKERWNRNAEEARRRFASLTDERSQVFLLNNSPDAIVPIRCAELWEAEVWQYRATRFLSEGAVLLFYRRGMNGEYRMWAPLDGYSVLLRFGGLGADRGNLGMANQILASCRGNDADALRAAFRWALFDGIGGFESRRALLFRTPKGPSREWVSTFNAYSTDLPEDSSVFSAEFNVDFPARHKSRTVVQGLVEISSEEVSLSEFGGHESYQFHLNGEILRDGSLFDTFRYKFNFAAEDIVDGRIILVFDRYLRPGEYQAVLKVEDLTSGTFYRTKRDITVPSIEGPVRAVVQDAETARLLAEANAAIISGDTTIQIVPPQGALHTGMLRVETLTTGRDIHEVMFSLDSKQILKKKRPPFNVELDLGSLPRMRRLAVTAFDSSGTEVAYDEVDLNTGSHRFAVRLVEPRPGAKYADSLRAQASVEVPEGKVVEQVEFYLNEDLIATLYQPPYEQPILLPGDNELAYVRVVAYQPDGNSTENLVFVNAPEFLEELEVQFVELFVTVLDRDRRPVTSLEGTDFQVVEDGVPQEILRFDKVTNLPIHAGAVLDISASMESNLEIARAAAMRFVEQSISARDRASLVTFNDRPTLAVKFTNDPKDFAAALAGLKAERGTALYDSLVFSLYYFNGIKGQRAIILLSDGKDETSQFSFEDCLEYARRAGVAIYTIGLKIPRKQLEARRRLTRFAKETGGRSFFVQEVEELPAIYDTIQEELRSRYYIAYQSSNTSNEDIFRTIEVDLALSGLEAKTLRGYYP